MPAEGPPSISRPDRVAAALANEQRPTKISNTSRRWRNIIRYTKQDRQSRRVARAVRAPRSEGRSFMQKLAILDQLRRAADYFIKTTTPSIDTPSTRRTQRRAGRQLLKAAFRNYFRKK